MQAHKAQNCQLIGQPRFVLDKVTCGRVVIASHVETSRTRGTLVNFCLACLYPVYRGFSLLHPRITHQELRAGPEGLDEVFLEVYIEGWCLYQNQTQDIEQINEHLSLRIKHFNWVMFISIAITRVKVTNK